MTQDKPPDDQQPEQKPRGGTGVFATAASVLAAAFGVQSSKNRERDFKKGKASHFIIGGIVFTAVFMAVVYTVVQAVLKASGQ